MTPTFFIEVLVPKCPELRGLGKVGMNHSQCVGQLCIYAVIAVDSVEDFVAGLFIGKIVGTDAAKDG